MADVRVTVGNVEIVALLDAVMIFPLERFFPSVPPEAWAPVISQYPNAFADTTRLRTNATGYVVRSQGRTILVDTGLGPGPHEFLGGARGNLLVDMESKGVRPEAIDLVVITHLHFDHVGWNATVVGEAVRPTFPHARYLIPQVDWEHYRRPEVFAQSSYIQHTVIALHELGLVDLVAGERAVTDELTIIPTPGHTPGHQSLLVQSQGQRAAITGDVAHSPAQVEHPDWSPGADIDPAQSRQTRHRMFDRIEAEGALMAACHFPNPGFGRLVRLEGRRVFQAL
ncbi:MAG: MBL fold metallo-hydrolase [Chloroflexi bacterium]|nr:MBL fold metallo-hydrolase [Chloroflexota bacterium]